MKNTVAVTADVVCVESKAKINIGVNDIHVETVESNAKINIGVNGINVETVETFETITATCHFSFEHAWKAKD